MKIYKKKLNFSPRIKLQTKVQLVNEPKSHKHSLEIIVVRVKEKRIFGFVVTISFHFLDMAVVESRVNWLL